jgi:hypothetical protein
MSQDYSQLWNELIKSEKRLPKGVDICTNLEKANGEMYSGDSRREILNLPVIKGLFVLWQEKKQNM